MTDKQRIGLLGEEAAVRLLEEKGYLIKVRNYRGGRAEIDIIAEFEDRLLVFIEVKTRNRTDYGSPASFYSKAQQRRVAAAAALYMEETGYDWEIRFDLVAVLRRGGEFTAEHFEDVFFPGLF